mmetsp:Transcript_32516/g.48130  ORF Transcript_32516/g.48130 Transcript_32516/m.48130 type:complete len:295 (-) Transcript_32516:165-1049(-)|eukprot:CAMPEP_0194207902 /NCGR_PEP_ID=MMETSP0156-20130528/6522_1 /TAXON_ID=33649 /ORGANISM="Thalassionema nitzschioides, Strain L26-B" /LENGTH=294 /DNA_ID=CAMNT_0038934773 /DNA_START=138 /DNA_END=1022 /DNA_ORIENTATION=+
MATESVYALAKISLNVWATEGATNKKKLEMLNEGLSDFGYKVIEESITTQRGMCYMAVWKSSTTKNCVLAFKGANWYSNETDKEQVKSIILGGEGSREDIIPTQTRAMELAKKYGVNLITGHSLGGYMAEIFATQNNYPGIAFCAIGTNGPFTKLGGEVVKGFHNVNFDFDNFGSLPWCTHVQPSIYVELGRKSHSIQDMIEYFKDNQEVTNMDIKERCTWEKEIYLYSKNSNVADEKHAHQVQEEGGVDIRGHLEDSSDDDSRDIDSEQEQIKKTIRSIRRMRKETQDLYNMI